ncbi:UMP kinase [Mycoplasmopsis arginini]|uniref:Uridylate kinase n=1 Tax=Mycoplasmopsis arginini TaxID=2094 RepID=A0AA43TZZ3_MYCAR|nr:UMP kinase [Mycoplasmopsis arginini]ENY69660.1 Uridylate kinase (PyrH) [Mycoplasmopsis arginini 7264]MCY2902653.1 UMP kinase [Mycoplasmopsis arginini QMP CG1-2758]MDI3348303.1 UMP kinase [Mycoplasmopsis arginini]MDI3348742.1 UMP kinase [Mycoplasmopsis arginini]MDI3349915.1 UMP kinase [Mycoplasmopsis arginini]
MAYKYKRVLIKLSGEGLANKDKHLAIDYELVDKFAKQLQIIISNNVEVAIVVGGGNFWRGTSAAKNGIQRVRADYIGMLATTMNALALQSGFEHNGLQSRVLSSLTMDPKVCEVYINEKAKKYLKDGEVVIFAGGTGRPFFTTDTASTLYASEIEADAILMGKNNVDGVYDSDPKFNDKAVKFDKLTYDELLERDLKVIDQTAASMAKDNDIDIIIFDINENDALLRAIENKIPNTVITKTK